MIKKIIIFNLVFLLIIPVVFAEISLIDRTKIQDQITQIVNFVNNGNVDSILAIVSPNAKVNLNDEIDLNLRGKTIQLRQDIISYEDLGNNQVKVSGRFSAAGPGWNVDALSNYFIFEKLDDSWLLVDTNFHQRMGFSYVLRFIGKIFAITIPILIVLGIFWLWMLIDAISRQFDDKTLWIILIIVLSFLGAILYFFIIRRKLKQQEKNYGSQPPQ